MKINIYVNRGGRLMHAISRKKDSDDRYRTLCGIRLPPCHDLAPDRVRRTEGLVLDCPMCQVTLAKLLQELQEEAVQLENPRPIPTKPANDGPGVHPDQPAAVGAGRKARKAGPAGS